MIFAGLLIFHVSSECIADLVPPFNPIEDRKIGNWFFEGSSIIHGDLIMLSPPLQYTKGCAWTNVELPKDNYSIQYEIRIHKGTGGGGFGFWFVDQFNSEENLVGGPNLFKGVALIGIVSDNDDTTHSLSLFLVQNNGAKNIAFSELITPDYILPFHHRYAIAFDIEFNNGSIRVSADAENGDDLSFLFQKGLLVSLEGVYTGITAQSYSSTSRFDIISVQFDVNTTLRRNHIHIPSGYNSIHYDSYTNIFRSPKFVLNTKEFQKRDDSIAIIESNADKLLEIIAELYSASKDVASFKELNEFVRTTILPYSHKWQKRTIKVVESIKNAKDALSSAFNYTESVVQSFNNSLRDALLKTNLKISNMTDVILSYEESGSRVIYISLGRGDLTVESVFQYITIIEVAILLIYIISKSNAFIIPKKNKSRVI